MAMIWEGKIWLSNGAQVPLTDLIVDSQTGRILRTISGEDSKNVVNENQRYITGVADVPVRNRYTSGNTSDITDSLTFDEKAAIRASVKSFDFGSPNPNATGVSLTMWVAIGAVLLIVGVILKTSSRGKK